MHPRDLTNHYSTANPSLRKKGEQLETEKMLLSRAEGTKKGFELEKMGHQLLT